jgi:hypothetical protein
MLSKMSGINAFGRSFSVAVLSTVFLSFISASVRAEPGYAGEWKKTRLYGHSYNSGDFTDEQYDWIRDNFEYFTIEKTHLRAVYGNPSHELTSRLTATRLIEANPRCKPLMIYSVGGAYDDLFESEAQALIDHPDYFLYDTNGVTTSLNVANTNENNWYIETVNSNCANSDLVGIFVDGFKGTYLSFPDNVRHMMEGMTGVSFSLVNGFDFNPSGTAIRDFPDLLEFTDGVFIDSFFRRRCTSADSAVLLLDACLQIPNDYMLVCFGSADGNTVEFGEWPITHEFTHAAYLIVANDNTYYRWVAEGQHNWNDGSLMNWHEDFGKEMGEPLETAVKNGYVYTRVFEHCTVTLDVENKTSSIEWGQNNGTNNLAPIADDAGVSTWEGIPVAIMLNGSDPNGDSLTYTVVDLPTNGLLAGAAPDLTYTPTNGYTGSDSFTFTVNDGVFTSALATVTILVTEPGSITWAAASTISDANDVSTNGTSVWAYSFGASGTAVVNGVNFIGESNAVGNADVVTDLDQSYTGYGNSIGTFSTLASEYQRILESGAYSGAAGTTITLSGLSIGNEYEVQFWLNDSRNRTDMDSKPRIATITNTSYVVDYNTAGASTHDGLGQYIIGTFTAQGPTQGIKLITVVPQLNAIQLRKISEPALIGDTISGALLNGTNMTLSWTTASGTTYGVEATTNLMTGSWVDITNGIAGNDELIFVTNGITERQQFFRVYLEE